MEKNSTHVEYQWFHLCNMACNNAGIVCILTPASRSMYALIISWRRAVVSDHYLLIFDCYILLVTSFLCFLSVSYKLFSFTRTFSFFTNLNILSFLESLLPCFLGEVTFGRTIFLVNFIPCHINFRF